MLILIYIYDNSLNNCRTYKLYNYLKNLDYNLKKNVKVENILRVLSFKQS